MMIDHQQCNLVGSSLSRNVQMTAYPNELSPEVLHAFLLAVHLLMYWGLLHDRVLSPRDNLYYK